MIQKIRLNITLADEIIHDDKALDGFIFAYMVKLTFVSGRINNANTRRICEVLGIGNRVCRRALQSALKHGYVRLEGNDIIAVNINEHRDHACPLLKNLKRISERTKDDLIRCPFRFTELRKIIRKDVIKNHIQKQNDFCNTIESSVNPHSKNELYRAKRRIKRMCKRPIAENTDRLSTKRIMEIANISRSTAKTLMRDMVRGGEIEKYRNIEQTDIDIQHELRSEYTKCGFKQAAKHWILNFAENVQKGFPILRWRWIDEMNCRLMVDIQYANSYKVVNPETRIIL